MNRRVLVVEESPLMRVAITNMLQNVQLPSIQVLPAENGFEALDTLSSQTVDLIITDLQADGIGFFRPPEDVETAGAIPVLVLAAEMPAKQIQVLLDRGATGYIVRTRFTESLVREVARALNAPAALQSPADLAG